MKIEVPIKLEGKAGKGIGANIAEQIEKSLGAIGLGKGKGDAVGIGKKTGLKIAGILGAIVGTLDAMMFLIKPVLELLKAVLILLFIPLIPIMKIALEALKTFAEGATKAPQIKMTGEPVLDIPISLANFALRVGGAIGEFLYQLGKGAFDLGTRIGQWMYDSVIKPTGDWIANVIISVGDYITKQTITAWTFLKDVGKWIWFQILAPAWNYLKSVGIWIWDIISSPWRWLADKIRGIWDWIKGALSNMVPSWLGGKKQDDFISRPGQGVAAFSPQDTIIGVKDPSKLFGGKSIIININNPSVRQSSDIKMLANEVSRVLQRQMPGRISTS